MANIKSVDKYFLGSIILLLVIGLLVLWSASTAESQQNFGNTTHYLSNQLFKGVFFGLALMYITTKVDYHKWKKYIPFALAFSLLALIAVNIPGIGFTANGAARWVSVGPIFFQPSELAKLSMILYLAGWAAIRGHDKGFWESVFPPLLVLGAFSGLILFQPDLGTMLSLCAIAFVMFFVGGIKMKYLASLIASGIGVVIAAIIIEPYRAERITTFLNQSIDPQGIGYQINQALLATGSGGWLGYGYGLSRQKFFYLPEAITDSVFAVMAEELGFIRVMLILSVFVFMIYRGLLISLQAPDTFGRMLSIGIITWISANSIINIGAILGLMPLTGIPLPFFSYGSSAMLVTLASLGIVLNISKTKKAS